MAKVKEKPLLLGAHMSAAGGVHYALLEAESLGATTLQLFTANQRRWKNKPLEDEEIELWHEALEETGMQQVMSHDSYLINLGAPDEEMLFKSRQAFQEEIERCADLDITYLNFHPGAALKEAPERCLDRIAESLLLCEKNLTGGSTRLLLETTAGQGSTVGWRFEELAAIIDKVKDKIPIGVCIDTCHIFAAGYDIRTAAAWEKTLEEFDRVIGLDKLYAFHLNDSLKGLGSRIDRHQPLGEGAIGLECFRVLMTHQVTRDLPKYLETPGGMELWNKEIQLLRELAKSRRGYAHKDQRD